MPAHRIAEAVTAGSASARSVTETALDEAARTDPGTFTMLHDGRARSQAAGVEASLANGSGRMGLTGVPIALKDLIDEPGIITTAGSSFLRDVATEPAAVVRRLERAGAVIVGRTNLHEFAYGFSSENEWFGPVRNPWDPGTSAGGSSGGSAAAVAAGITPIAIGTDTGGSVRVPAAMCGVMGLKVTHGRIPLTGVFPLASSLDTVGPIATTVQDLSLAYRAMRGPDDADPWSRPVAPTPVAAHVPLRIGVPRPWVGSGPVDPAIVAAFDEFLTAAEALRLDVIELEMPDLVPWGLLNELAGAQAARVHRRWVAEGRPYGREVGERLAVALEVTVDELSEALSWQAAIRHRAVEAFAEVDLLATPSVGSMRKVIGDELVDVGDTRVSYRPALAWFTALVNHLGAPALSLPLAVEGSPPPSIQLIGRWWNEETLIAVGRRLEREGVVGTRLPQPAWWESI
jgi:Asp-tRNA(Asn)/Glu-tRNA(Gln) amidotransferase A subunit family amidase